MDSSRLPAENMHFESKAFFLCLVEMLAKSVLLLTESRFCLAES
jgi:hypothetical protein